LIVALERRGVAMPRPIGLEHDLGDLAIVSPAGGDALGAMRAAAMQQHHVGVLGANLVEYVPDALMVVAIGAAGKGDAGSGRDEDLGFGAAASGKEIAAVDHRCGQAAVIDLRAGARAPDRAGCRGEQLGSIVAEELEGIAALDQAHALLD